MQCRNPPIVFTRIRSPRAKSMSTRIRSHFLFVLYVSTASVKNSGTLWK